MSRGVRFDEAWLADYQRRLAEQQGKTVDQPSRAVKRPVKASNPIQPSSDLDESWLVDYQRRQAIRRGEPAKPAPLLIEFEIPIVLKLLNKTQGKLWIYGYRYRKELQPIVAEATRPWHGHHPIEKARVTVTRYTVGPKAPDPDNHAASLKPLLDLLLVKSDTHPHSLGLLRDDSPEHLTTVLHRMRVATRAEQRTHVRIEAIL